MSYISEVNKVARQILDKLNEQETNDKVVISNNSTGRVESFLCPACSNEVSANDTECSECHTQLN
ncbi:MAG: hypothetical protein H2184_15735 [Candidatus Galacturonibacter soehngenii]|nr:hypothetical protein [Candidatus Galacturonibacter soehngenii]